MMEPIEMPEEWHSQFVGVKIHTGHRFRISKAALTNSIMQFANYAIDIGDGIILKHRWGYAGESSEMQRREAKMWPILHTRSFGGAIMRELERAGVIEGTRYESVTEEREWESEVLCSAPSLASIQLTGIDGIS